MSKLVPPVNENDHIRGDASALVTLVEFGDFECPFCGAAHRVVQALDDVLGDRLRFVFRHFPLMSVHPHAAMAAEAAQAVGAQGRFWQMHDMLFEHQDALELPDLESYATALGLDVDTFERDILTHRFVPKIRDDLHSGAISGVNGTPTFFINGYRHDGPVTFDALMGAIAGAASTALIG